MKNRVVKRIVALASVAAVTMTGCGGGAETSAPAPEADNTETADAEEEAEPEAEAEAEEEEEVSPYTVITDENGDPIDLGGIEIIIRDWWSGDPAEPTNDYEAARDEYREWIQETYNFTIKHNIHLN